MVYITGDMHGDDARWYDRQLKKLKAGDTLLICGDFGYVWNGGKREKKDLEYLGSRPYAIGFLDGTHENFDLLYSYRQTVWNGGRVHRISGTLFHLIRGQIFTIEGQRYFVFGGGESPDKEIRLEQRSWWREELPSPAEMSEGAENLDEVDCKVDYILTHEPPSMVKSAVLLRSGHADRVSKLNGYLEEVDRSCTYKHWYFGSIHEDRTITPKHTALFRKLIPVGEDLSNEEDNNFFRSMLGGRRAVGRKTAPGHVHGAKPAEEAQKAAAVKPVEIKPGPEDKADAPVSETPVPEKEIKEPVPQAGATPAPAELETAAPVQSQVDPAPEALPAQEAAEPEAPAQGTDTGSGAAEAAAGTTDEAAPVEEKV